MRPCEDCILMARAGYTGDKALCGLHHYKKESDDLRAKLDIAVECLKGIDQDFTDEAGNRANRALHRIAQVASSKDEK